MNKIKIGAGIVSYNPDIDLLEKNIEAIILQVDELIIFDNGSSNAEQVEAVCKKYEIRIIRSDENIGIAAALNRLFYEIKQKKEIWWLLTLDQDTVCPDNLINKLKKHCDENVGIISPNYINRGAEKKEKNKLNGILAVEWTITSASLTNVKAWEKVGGFDEYLFIDGVDTDFGIRLNKAGFLVLMDRSVSVSHKLGNSELRRLLGRTYCIQNHNAFRKYYISRNSIIVANKNYGAIRVMRAYMGNIKSILKVLIFEQNKKEKIISIFKGGFDATIYIFKNRKRG